MKRKRRSRYSIRISDGYPTNIKFHRYSLSRYTPITQNALLGPPSSDPKSARALIATQGKTSNSDKASSRPYLFSENRLIDPPSLNLPNLTDPILLRPLVLRNVQGPPMKTPKTLPLHELFSYPPVTTGQEAYAIYWGQPILRFWDGS